MKQNIYFIIGDNALGKTRYLNKLAKTNILNGLKVVTNLRKYDNLIKHKVDDNKLNILLSSSNMGFNIAHSKNTKHAMCISTSILFKLLTMEGDILILDEVDANIEDEYIVSLASAISTVRSCWKAIYVSGYNLYLSRMFLDIDEDYNEVYQDNFYTLDKDLKLVKISEDEANEYFDSL